MDKLIAVIDDDASNLKAADKILSLYGYRVICLDSGEALLGYVENHRPDLVLLDVHMTGIDGFETLQKLRMTKKGRDIPVIFLTADNDAETETRALSAGAMDFVAKPFVASVLILRVRNTLQLISLQSDLKSEVKRMTSEIMEEHERNEKLSLQIVQTLATTIDAKDNYTNGHSVRVAEYAREIARIAGYSEKAQEDIYMMGLLHDVGKIGIPDSVINKPSKLTEEEYDIIKTHPLTGYDILKNITEMPMLAIGAKYHHERIDGKGYPDGLKGDEIPEEARIIAVADAYDAMSSRRSYHDVFAQEYIIGEFENNKGTQFDERFANIMLELIEEDKDYIMRENFDDDPDSENSEKTAAQNEQDDKVFGFLSMLEAAGINSAVGLQYCMNDVDFYYEMLGDFSAGSDDRAVALATAMENGDWGKYRVYVHSLKSASKSVGAMTLSDKAAELERAVRDENYSYIKLQHPELIALLKSTSGSILMASSMYGLG